MKRTLNLIILSVLFITPAFCFDPPQKGYSVVIEKDLLNEIDKIYVFGECSKDSQIVDVKNESYFFPFQPKSTFKIKLKNQDQLYPADIKIDEAGDNVYVSKKSDTITFKVEKYVDFKANAPLLFSIYLLLIVKLILTFIFIKPTSKLDFIKKYGLIYLIFFLILLIFSDSWGLMFIIIALFGSLVFVLFDFVFLFNKYRKKGVLAFTLSSIIVASLGIILFNLVF